MSEQDSSSESSANLIPLGEFTLPSFGKSLGAVYKVGSLPLALLLVGGGAFIWLLVGRVAEAIAISSYVISALLVSCVIIFLAMNIIAYLQWRYAFHAELEARKVKAELFIRLSTSNAELQDKFVLALLEHMSKLLTRPDSTPEGRKAELEVLSKSVGGLVTEFLRARSRVKLPEIDAPSKQSAKAKVTDA